jgi:hypothetical protein
VSGSTYFQDYKSSGTLSTISVTQTQPNSSDTADVALQVSHTLVASSATNELVVRALALNTVNSLTGGGAITNMRCWNLASTTNASTTTTNLDQIYIENVTGGTVTNGRAIRVKSMQGAAQAGLSIETLTGTNNTYLLLGGNSTIPTGKWAIYQSETTYSSSFSGIVGISATPTGTYKLEVGGSIGATAYYETSDITKKTILETNPTVSLDLDVIKFIRKDDLSNDIRYGYSAQQVRDQAPELINPNGELSVKYVDIHTLKIASLEKRVLELETIIKKLIK